MKPNQKKFFAILAMLMFQPAFSYAGVSAIKSWSNFTDGYATVSNRERPGELMGISNMTSSNRYQWWVPWVSSQSDVNNKAIEVRVHGNIIGCVFQGTNNDGHDRVRFSRSCSFEYTDQYTYVNGDMTGEIHRDGNGHYFVFFRR